MRKITFSDHRAGLSPHHISKIAVGASKGHQHGSC